MNREEIKKAVADAIRRLCQERSRSGSPSTWMMLFSVKQISPFSSSEFPIVIVGKSPLSAGLVRKQVPLLHPAA